MPGEALSACASATVAASRKPSAKTSFLQARQTHHFFCSLTFNLICPAWIRQTRDARFDSKGKWNRALQLVPQSFLMPVRLHTFPTLVLGDFCFPSFFKGAHSDFSSCDRLNHLIHRSASVVADCTIWIPVMAPLRPSSYPAHRCRFSSGMVRSIVCGPGIFRSTH